MPAREPPPLNWHRDDVERRFGFRGGRFTQVGNLPAMLAAAGATIAFYAALIPWGDEAWAAMFTRRGPTQYAVVFLSAWSVAILFLKQRKLAMQRQALRRRVAPEEPDFVLSAATADQVARLMDDAVDDPRCFVVFNRIEVALSNLRNLGRVTDVDEILRSQAAQDEAVVETSYGLLHGFVWAIPVLGFIGTVLGLSEAIGGFSGVIAAASDFSAVAQALQGVTAGLSTAFETTLVALVAALGIQLWLTVLRKAEEEFLDDVAEYCLRNIVNRLRILPFETEAAT